MRKNVIKVCIGIAAILIFGSTFALAQNRPTDTFGIGAVYHNDRNPGWLIYELKPGDSFEDYVFVQNKSPKPLDLRLYPQDAINAEKNESFKIYDENKTPSESQFLSKWITLEKNSLKLDSNDGEEVKFTIKIPVDAAQKEYGGVIFAHRDPQTGDLPSDVDTPQGKTSAIIGARVGVRVYLTVTNTPNMPRRYKPMPQGYTVAGYMFFSIVFIGFLGGSYFIFKKDIKKIIKRFFNT